MSFKNKIENYDQPVAKSVVRILLIESKNELLRNFLRRGRLTSNKPFNFSADRDHDPAPGFLTKFVRLRDGQLQEFYVRD